MVKGAKLIGMEEARKMPKVGSINTLPEEVKSGYAMAVIFKMQMSQRPPELDPTKIGKGIPIGVRYQAMLEQGYNSLPSNKWTHQEIAKLVLD